MSQINVGIIGFGTVGAGTYELLVSNREIIAKRVGTKVVVRKIADLDTESDRGVPFGQDLLTTDAMDLINDPDIDIVVELMGGLKTAADYILKAMDSGKHVVTANKALLAERGEEIYQTTRRCGVSLGFEASVGGGIPILNAMKRGLSANRIQTIMGILNGTSNYILTGMTRKGLPYDQVVKEAVELGFAEDPPTLDVDGTDAAHKLAILISIAFGSPASFSEIYREGIVDLTPDDLRYASEFGYSVKLLAVARDLGDRMDARVHPAMIPENHILANVNDAYNAIYLEGDFVGQNLYYGLGAGRRTTASAVVSDIIGLARQIRLGNRGLIPPLAHELAPGRDILIQPIENLTSPYYFRFSALDRPGVLSKIAGVLGEHNISISSVIQKGREVNRAVPIVMLTHEARESDVQKALSLMDDLDILTDRTIMMRVEDR